jgi:hypothetical protein
MRQATALGETLRQRPLSRRAATVESMAGLVLRVPGEFVEMPGLGLTAPQAARFFGVAPDVAHAVLDELSHTSVLTSSNSGMYSLARRCPRTLVKHRDLRGRSEQIAIAGSC